MSISSNEEECGVLDPLTGRITKEKTQGRYKMAYANFIKWKTSKKYKDVNENTFIEYFIEMSKKHKPTTLWCTYSMLRSTVKSKDGVDIRFYSKLIDFLKGQSVGFTSKKSEVLSMQDIQRFLNEAPDYIYLAIKVALIFGINGSCNRNEIGNITIKDVEEHGEILLVKIKNTNYARQIPRSFAISGKYYQIVKKYMDLRCKQGACERFFQHYRKGKCINQPIGVHKLGIMPKEIARFLGLPNPNDYTGHSYKKSSKIIQMDKGTPNILMDIKCQPEEEASQVENCNEKMATYCNKKTEPHPPSADNEILTSRQSCENNNKKCSPERRNKKSNTEMDVSSYELALSPLSVNVKTDPDLSSSPEDPLSPASTSNERQNREESPCFTYKNTSYDNNILRSLSQTVKTSDKNVKFTFNNCTFTNCFNNVNNK